MRSCFLFVVLSFALHVVVDAQSQNTELLNLRNQGNYLQLVDEVQKQLKIATTDADKFFLYDLLAEGYLQLNYLPDHLKAIKQSRKYNPNKKIAGALFYAQLGNYYHYQLMTDSSVFNSMIAKRLLAQNSQYADSTTICRIYAYYGNCNRNLGEKWLNKQIYSNVNNTLDKYALIKSYLDTAYSYAQSDYWRFDILNKIATSYAGGVALIRQVENDTLHKWAHKISNQFYFKALRFTKSPLKKARVFSLMALSDYYVYDYKRADSLYRISEKLLTQNDTVLYLYAYLANQQWRGWNLDEWYEAEGNKAVLQKATKIYEESAIQWDKFYLVNASKVKGYHDGYGLGVQNKLAVNYYRLFNETGDSTFIEKSFNASEKAKYPTSPFERVTLKQLQKTLSSKTAFIQSVGTQLPERSYYFVITKNSVDFIDKRFITVRLDPTRESMLYQFDDLKMFRKISFQFYQAYFSEADAILRKKRIQNVIVSNSDRSSMLNYDVLVSDTAASTWKDLPYLFHTYNFTYALTASSYLASFKSGNQLKRGIGVTLGQYDNDVNLKFSERLSESLMQQYDGEKVDFATNIRSYNVGILLAHGDASVFKQNGKIRLSSTEDFSSLDIFNEHLSNELFIMTACNSNLSTQWNSEGVTSNFAKSLRYAGVKSVLTVSWEIDDKTNTFFIEKFLGYITKGYSKNDALWQTKKDYWAIAKQDEEFKPLYWAPYILTGNIEPVEIEKRSNWTWYLLLLLFPVTLGLWLKSHRK